MSARRWNKASELLRDIGVLPLGLCGPDAARERLYKRSRELLEACEYVDVLPY